MKRLGSGWYVRLRTGECSPYMSFFRALAIRLIHGGKLHRIHSWLFSEQQVIRWMR